MLGPLVPGAYIPDEITGSTLSSRRARDIELLVTLSPPVSLIHQPVSETVESQFTLNANNGTSIELPVSSVIPGGRRAETDIEPSSATSGTELGSIFSTNGSVTLTHSMVIGIYCDDHGSDNTDSHLLSQASTSTLDPLDPLRLPTCHVSTASRVSQIYAENGSSSPEPQPSCICSQVKQESVDLGKGKMHALVALPSPSNLNEAHRPIPSSDAYHVDFTEKFLPAFDTERGPTSQLEGCSALRSGKSSMRGARLHPEYSLRNDSDTDLASIADPSPGRIIPSAIIPVLTLPRFGSIAEELSPLFSPLSHENISNVGSVEEPIHVSDRSPPLDNRTLWIPIDSRRNGRSTVLTKSNSSKRWRPAAAVTIDSGFAEISDLSKESTRSFAHASVQTDAEHLRTRNRYLEKELKKVQSHRRDAEYKPKPFWTLAGLKDLLHPNTNTAVDPRLGTLMPSDAIDSSANSFGLPVI